MSWEEGTNDNAEPGDTVMIKPELATPTVHLKEQGAPRLAVAVTLIKQRVEAQAFGSPSDARRLGATAVDEHDAALRRLAD
jgi:hypothetical protein